ncbi:MAG: ATP-grasp domain-containing protein [Phreatobacter sp.]|uniref:ATP-binding protein n=1 Tax=Phreatobacter sp. TaxID=1966341 RepID=UPI001A55CA72|nr:biotin carboxylase N-terminal domain-containing protein [Phreatobacter sp.]MBL8571269.1 ATP-grasp domain-containing protein [Phreatobacter sp.]
MARLIRKVLIANRGEIACRIAATCRKLGIVSVAVYSEADRDALHVRSCDEAVLIGPSDAAQSYLLPDRLVAAARETGADAIHPGYGFLAENPGLARRCAEAGIAFIGPSPEAIVAMGSKLQARRIASERGIPTVPGYDGADQSDDVLAAAARRVGFPLLIKASAGGGGKGIRIVEDAEGFATALDLVRRESAAAFADSSVLLERFIPAGRHIEVQVLGDAHGNLVHLFDRECSLQRRHQKVFEEAPAPLLPEALRLQLLESSVRLAKAIDYSSLGTVEFLYDPQSGDCYFLEMNTRIQVEHPVTEMVTGLDLVALQILVAGGGALPFTQADVAVHGHAIEARLNAEMPEHGFVPALGRIERIVVPDEVGPSCRFRFDTGIAAGSTVTPYYDSMLAKLIVWAPDRETAWQGLATALEGLGIDGIATNAAYLGAVLQTPEFRASTATTRFLDGFKPWEIAPSREDMHRGLMAAAVAEVLTQEAVQRDRSRNSPWGSLGGWRLLEQAGSAARLVVDFEDDTGGRHRVAVSGRKGAYQVDCDGETVAIEARQDGERFMLRSGDRAFTARVERSGAKRFVAVGPLRQAFRYVDPAERMSSASAGAKSGLDIAAPTPGLVVEVLVAPGDAVEAGQPVVVLEAMKMIHNLTASGPGVVAEVACRKGDTVAMGRSLIRFAGEA